MYFNRPVVKMEVKRSMRQTRPHPMLVTLLYLVIVGVGTGLISWLTNTLFRDTMSMENLFFGLMTYGEEYLEYFVRHASQLMVQAMLVSLLVSLLTTSWTGLMGTGYAGYCLNMSRDMNPPLEHIFSGFSRAGSVILSYILVAVFTFLWTLLFTVGLVLLFIIAALLAETSSSMAALGILLLLAGVICYAVAIVWVSYRYAMVPFILADSQGPVSALDVIRASKTMMRGRKGSFFVLQISFIGWFLLEALIVLIGLIVAVAAIASYVPWYFDEMEYMIYLLSMIYSGNFDIMTELLVPVLLVSLVCAAVIFIINLWLTPYRTGCEAHFYLYALGGGQPNPYQPGPYGGQPGPYGGQSGPYGGQPGPYGGQSGQYGSQSGQYGGQPGPYGGQPGQYGSQPGPYGGQSGQYGGQPSQYGGQPSQYGSQSGQYGGQPGQYGGQPGPYGGQSGQYGGQPGQYGGKPGQYNNPNIYQPPGQSTSGGYTQGAQSPQYGAAQWGAPQAPQAPQVPQTPQAPRIPHAPQVPVSAAPTAPAVPEDTPAEPDDAPYEAPYAEPEASGDDDTPQKPDDSQV